MKNNNLKEKNIVLNFKDFCLNVGEKVYFNNINLTLFKGEKYILQGDNNTGKSLLLKVIFFGQSNILQWDYPEKAIISGNILNFENKNILDSKCEEYRKLHFAYIDQFEDEVMRRNDTLYSYIESTCFGMNINIDEEKLDKILTCFNLFEKKYKKIKHGFSGGELKLIHIISKIMILQHIDLLLMDEPLNHLSIDNMRKLNNILKQEVSKDLTIIMVSHCKALTFVDKGLRCKDKTLVKENYKAYNCFE